MVTVAVDVDSTFIVLAIVVVFVVAGMMEDLVTCKVVVVCAVTVLATVTVTGGFNSSHKLVSLCLHK